MLGISVTRLFQSTEGATGINDGGTTGLRVRGMISAPSLAVLLMM
jgi:hypothetical protein